VPGELKPVYLLAGSDRPKIARALERLRARIGEEGVQLLSAAEASGADAVAHCNSMGLLAAGRRLVVVHDVERWKAPDVKAVTAYLGDPAPDTVLALAASGIKREAPLAKTCAAVGELLVFDVVKRRLPQWVAQQFARVGATADEEACRALIEIVGDDLDALAGEVDKLAVWAGGEPITAADVQSLAPPLAETPGYALSDAWGRRDLPATLEACESIFERAGGSRRDELPRIAGMLTAHVGRVRDCQIAAALGERPRDVAARLKKAPFYVEKLFAQAGNFTADELRDAVVHLAALDLALKGGSKLPGDLELERTLVSLTTPGAGEPAGA
jgi:DNA polymerase III subunit delta